jgi:hypothetical protein
LAALAISVSLLYAPLLVVPAAQAAPPIRFSGELSGLVTDAMGKPEPGAVVLLFNKQERLLQRVATAPDGSFSFADLLPDLYSIRVTVANFIPAAKDSILVKPGMRSLLDVSLSRIFSSVQLVSTTPAPGGLMSDGWKWTLRSDNAMRPILRFLPELSNPSSSSSSSESSSDSPVTRTAIFTDSRGLIRLSASDGAEIASDGEADLGTQFAFATSMRGGSRVLLAGDVGYGLSGTPSAAIRTTYSRSVGGITPSVSVTMRQIFLPIRSQALVGNGGDSTPALRTMAVNFGDKAQLTDSMTMEYGFELDQVSFVDRLHYFSPYAKVDRALAHGSVDFGWTSGNARPELGANPSEPNDDLQQDLTSLSMLPRVSLADGHAHVQRADNYELGLTQRFGSREYRVEGYEQHISNTALTIASPGAGLFSGDLLPDLFSNSAVFDMGSMQTFGYNASVTQDLGDAYKIAVAYGSTGVLAAQPGFTTAQSADELRSLLGVGHRPAVTLRGSGTVRCTGTRFIASYQWTDYRSATPAPQVSSDSSQFEPGLNVMVRQPVPLIPGTGWRVEATAELRNVLAQGYLPLTGPGGERILVVNMPRSLRGGLAFVF